MRFPDEREDGGYDHRGQGSTRGHPEKLRVPRALKNKKGNRCVPDQFTCAYVIGCVTERREQICSRTVGILRLKLILSMADDPREQSYI
jgi:hypothetical protein